MSFPRYPGYKDSGVEWLGDVPEHWGIMRVKNVALINMGQSPNSQDCNQEGEGIPFLQGNADFGKICPLPRHYCSVANKIAKENDILLSVRAPVGAINLADQNYGIGRGLCAITPITDNSQRYLLHELEVIKCELFSVATGSTYESVSVEQIVNARCLFPPSEEQQTIAAFLDRETAKIDALIAEQQRLIELLKEKRQAVISHAVTKGLNPNAPMKDSGIEWLGEVPEHWDVKRLKYNLRLLTEKTDRRENPIALENVEGWSGRFIPTETTIEGEGVAFERGDILFGKLRPYLAKAYLAEGSGEAVGDFHVLRPNTTTQSRFSQYQILNREFIAIVDGSTFGAKMPRVSWDFLGNMALTVPPVPEQQTIAAFLDRETAKLDTLTTEAQTAITLLKERRTALISAAVTGKIDVRALVFSDGK